jgi:hypothetical protein
VKLTKNQKGMSTIVLIIVVGFFAYAIFIGLKITPVYLEYFTIKSSVDALAEEMKTRQMTKGQFISLMKKRMDLNYVSVNDLVPQRDGCEKTSKEVFLFQRGKKEYEIGASYEKRIPIIANIDFLLNFEHKKAIPIASK